MKKIISTAITSVSALLLGFGLMAFPFHLFESLTGAQARLVFVAEIIVYFGIFAIAAIRIEQRKDKKEKDAVLVRKHNERIEKRNSELRGIKVHEYDLVA